MGDSSEEMFSQLSGEVLAIYNNMANYRHLQSAMQMDITRSNAVTLDSLCRTLDSFRQRFTGDVEAIRLLNTLQINATNMPVDGKTKIFSYVVKEGVESRASYIFAVVRRYVHRGDAVMDFCISTYSYSWRREQVGNATVSNVSKGAFALLYAAGLGTLTVATGGLGLLAAGGLLAGSVASAVTARASRPREVIRTASGDSSLPANLKSILLACFIDELVRKRRYAVVRGDEVFLVD